MRSTPGSRPGIALAVVVRLELVAHSANSGDALAAQLLAQVADVHVDDVRARVEVVAPRVVEERLTAQNVPWMAEEHLRQRELARAQLRGALPDPDAPRAQVEDGIACTQHRLCGGAVVP